MSVTVAPRFSSICLITWSRRMRIASAESSAARWRLPICQASATRWRASRPRTSISASGLARTSTMRPSESRRPSPWRKSLACGKSSRNEMVAPFGRRSDVIIIRRRWRAVSSRVIVASGAEKSRVTSVQVREVIRLYPMASRGVQDADGADRRETRRRPHNRRPGAGANALRAEARKCPGVGRGRGSRPARAALSGDPAQPSTSLPIWSTGWLVRSLATSATRRSETSLCSSLRNSPRMEGAATRTSSLKRPAWACR
jgi:hypothetical protein